MESAYDRRPVVRAPRRRGAAPRRLAGVLLLALAALPTAAAQTVELTGRVTDAQGEALRGATVTADAPGLPAPAVAVSGDDGEYALALVPGGYTLTFTLDGFDPRREDVRLAAGSPQVLDVTLAVGTFAERVDVVAVTPVPGAGIDRARVPAAVSVIDGGDLAARGAASMADALHERFGSVTLEGTTTNPFQPTLRFRGFTASPLLGLPQGIAVYQNGVRINEPLGDTVQFDLFPQFAVNRVQFSAGADPAYGLNALGGALSLELANGFDAPGFRGEVSGGSFGRYTTTAEYGVNNGQWAFYAGASRFSEAGWRDESPSEVAQAFADLAWRGDGTDAGLSVTWADTSLTGNAPAPVELLDVDRTAVFTFPDRTDNRLAFVQGRARTAASDTWSLQVTGYYRGLDRRTLNGDEADFGVCGEGVLPDGAPEQTLCFGDDDDDDDDDSGGNGDDDGDDGDDDDGDDDGDDGDDDDGDDNGDDDHDDGDDDIAATPLVDFLSRQFITRLDAAGDAAYNRTTTLAAGYGATVQATANSSVGGRDNVLVAGVSADLADVDFTTSSEVGTLTPARGVTGSARLASLHGLGGDDLFNTAIDTANRAIGLYASNTLSASDRVHLTVSGRYNRATIDIADRLGTSLDGAHEFARLNPAVGAVVEAGGGASLFARYSESNRAPTAAELSCADPAEPCRVPNAFTSDPPLEQAVAQSVEAGLRGRWSAGEWSASAYRTGIDDDILFIASPELIGAGYFQNAGDTRRVGIDLEVSGRRARTSWYVGYGLLDATFQSALELPGDDEVNDAASEEGAIAVEPGDRLPGIPRHSLKAGVRQALTDAWDAAFEMVAASDRVFVGDEGNDQVRLDGYGVVNLRSTYRLDQGLELFVRVENLLDARYATAGVLAELEVPLREAPDASDPRFIGPGQPRSAFAGVRVRF